MGSKVRCRCQVYGCVDGVDPDPWSQVPTSGRLLPASTAHQHRRDDRIWQSAKQSDSAQPDLCVARIQPQDHTDDVVSSRALQTALGNQPLPISQDQFRVDDKGSMATELECLQQYRNMFQSSVLSFTPPRLKFLPSHTVGAGVQPPLDLTDTKGSRSLMVHREFMQKLLELVEAVVSNGEEVTTTRKKLVMDIQEHQRYVDRLVDCEWRRQHAGMTGSQSSVMSLPIIVNTDHLYNGGLDALASTSLPMLLSVVGAGILHILAGLSREHANFLLLVFQAVFVSTFGKTINDFLHKRPQPHLQNQIQSIASSWPTDIRSGLTLLSIDPDLHQYICCPRCFSLYGPFPEDQTTKYENVPTVCNHRATPSSTSCGAQLFGKDAAPNRRFWYQSLDSWIARFLSRVDVMTSLRSSFGSISDRMHDTWDGKVFREFRGPDGGLFFNMDNSLQGSEVRLGFSLFVDWFNPFGNRQGGKHTSFGAIYMVCHNLPAHTRYQLENVYIAGIIPGPQEPSYYYLNHVLQPLVDDLSHCWSPGLQLTRTAVHIFGCLVRCAVVLLVCDLPAARKTAGLAGLGRTSGKFCSFCQQDGSDFKNTDISTWPRRSWQEHLSIARMWRDAQTESVRQRIYDTFGIRWTELLRLPYWDPTRFIVVEAMHNFFLGDLQHHCRKVFGMDAEEKSNNTHVQLHTPAEQQQELESGIEAIWKGSVTALLRLRRGYIVALAEANNVLPEIKISSQPLHKLSKADQTIGKAVYAQALVDWYKQYNQPEIRCPPVFPRPIADLSTAWSSAPSTTILDQLVLSEVWKDMEKTTLPSCVTRAPRNLGSRSHGKLKADQWRTACLVNLVITLCRLWGGVNASQKNQSLLRNYLSLVIAVRWATTRTTSNYHSDVVQQFLVYYIHSTLEIFGARALVYNNHASLHVPECLGAYGPAHGWWAFPFERYNGVLQRVSTNSRIGQMEHTMLKAFCRGSNLRAMLSKENSLASLQVLRTAFKQFFPSASSILQTDLDHLDLNGMNSDIAEITDSVDKLPTLSTTTYDGLLDCLNEGIVPRVYLSYRDKLRPHTWVIQPHAQEKRLVKYRGVTFSCSSKHLGNSRILFRLRNETLQRAGEIQRIFVHQRHGPSNTPMTEFFYVVRRYRELSDAQAVYDPYRKFPLLFVRLCHDELMAEEQVIRNQNVMCHFAGCPYESEELPGKFLVVLSLDKE